MVEVARVIVARTTNQFPIALVGLGLIATIFWICAVTTLAFQGVWSVLKATALLSG
jgi:hypothetical protein